MPPKTTGKTPSTGRSLNTFAPRSRKGCLVCRSRRIKCDEAKPSCGRCDKFNAQCKYPEKKQFSDEAIANALAARTKYRRRARQERSDSPASGVQTHRRARSGSSTQTGGAGPSTPAAGAAASTAAAAAGTRPPLSPASPVREMTKDWFTFERVTALFRRSRMGQYYHHPTDPPDLLKAVFPDETDRRCFHHCIAYSLSIMVTDESSNPWVQLVAPLCFSPHVPVTSVEALRSAFLAFGATHLYSLQLRHPETSDSVDYRAVSQNHRSLSACRLRKVVKAGGPELESDTFLAAALALLLNDVFAAGTSWREVWRYALLAIRRRGGPQQILFGSAVPPTALRRCLIGHAAFWDFVVSINTITSPVLLAGDLGWWQRLSDLGPEHAPGGGGSTGAPDLEWDWLEKFTAMHPSLFAITSVIVSLAADCAQLQRLVGPVPLDAPWDPADAHADTRRRMADRAAAAARELERWRYELPTALSSARVQIGSLALWHAARIVLLTQVHACARADADVQASASAVLELCVEAGDKPEFLQLPLMVAASVIEAEEQRDIARGIIETMEYVAVFEVRSLAAVVEESWSRMRDGMDDVGCRWPEVQAESGVIGLVC